MKTYTIRHEETLVGYYEIEAESPEEALEKYEKMCDDGEIDFTDLDIVNDSNSIIEPIDYKGKNPWDMEENNND